MRIPQIIDAFSVPKSNPPFAKGLVRKSPNVAPKGLVKIKATQNKNDEKSVKKMSKKNCLNWKNLITCAYDKK